MGRMYWSGIAVVCCNNSITQNKYNYCRPASMFSRFSTLPWRLKMSLEFIVCLYTTLLLYIGKNEGGGGILR